MANPEHIEKLKKGVMEWNAWRDSEPIKIDLNGADLSDAKLGRPDVRRDFSNADLRGAKLVNADLTLVEFADADLGWADLSGAKLHDANFLATDLQCSKLSGADLSEAVFTDANLTQANLSKANLSKADLGRANCWAANFSDANLSEANIGYANFAHAKLLRTNFFRATLIATVFADTDLTGVTGLESCSHLGPSSVDILTLENAAKLPDIFLRGCGFSDELIQYLPSFWNNPIEFYSCFISYSHADKPFAKRLHDTLQGRGIRCWLDEHQLLPGDSMFDGIDIGIRLWDKILLCCSETSLNSWWVDNEIQLALKKEEQLYKERGKKTLALIPLNLDGYLLSGKWQSGMSTQITNRRAADFTGWKKDNEKFDAQFERVVKALRADAGAREKPPKSKL